MPPLQSSNISILKEVKFTNFAVFVADIAVVAYTKGLFYYTYIADKFHFNYGSVSKTAETKTAVSSTTRLPSVTCQAYKSSSLLEC